MPSYNVNIVRKVVHRLERFLRQATTTTGQHKKIMELIPLVKSLEGSLSPVWAKGMALWVGETFLIDLTTEQWKAIDAIAPWLLQDEPNEAAKALDAIRREAEAARADAHKWYREYERLLKERTHG